MSDDTEQQIAMLKRDLATVTALLYEARRERDEAVAHGLRWRALLETAAEVTAKSAREGDQ